MGTHNFLNILETHNKAINEAKEKLKELLINYFTDNGDINTASEIKRKGIPESLHVYGEETTCVKSPFISIQTSPIVEKGTIIAVWNKPKYPMGGIVNNENLARVSGPEMVLPIKPKSLTPYEKSHRNSILRQLNNTP